MTKLAEPTWSKTDIAILPCGWVRVFSCLCEYPKAHPRSFIPGERPAELDVCSGGRERVRMLIKQNVCQCFKGRSAMTRRARLGGSFHLPPIIRPPHGTFQRGTLEVCYASMVLMRSFPKSARSTTRPRRAVQSGTRGVQAAKGGGITWMRTVKTKLDTTPTHGSPTTLTTPLFTPDNGVLGFDPRVVFGSRVKQTPRSCRDFRNYGQTSLTGHTSPLFTMKGLRG